MAQDKKKSFVLYYSYREHLALLTDEERGKLLMALLEYGETGEKPALSGAPLMAFSFIACQMDRDAAKYAKTCKSRSEAGKQGGRPPKANETEGAEGEATESKPKQPKAKKANAFSKKQTKANQSKRKQGKAKKADNDNDNDNENDNENDNVIDIPLPPLTPPTGEEAPVGAAVVEVADIPYGEIVNLYHEICHSYPKLKVLTDKRKEAIAESFEKCGRDIEVFRELFTKAEASRFLRGKGEKGWQATFNWLIDSDHMAEVLEGKYDNRQREGKSFDEDDFFEAALRRTYSELEEDEEKTPPKTAGEDEDLRKRGEELRMRLAQ